MYDPHVAPRSLSPQLRLQLETDMVQIWEMARGTAENDRTLAVVATAFLESILTEAIAVRLPVLDDDVRTTLFDPQRNAPLSSYASKVYMARAMFVVDGVPYEDLKIVGRIRNQFAHNVRVNTFDHHRVLPLVLKLKAPSSLDQLAGEQTLQKLASAPDGTPRGRFAHSVANLANGLFNCSITDTGFGAACLR